MSLVTLLASALVLEKTVVNDSRSLAKEILSAFYDLRLVLFGRRPIALLALGFVTYGALITIRGLWIVPMVVERYALTLVIADTCSPFSGPLLAYRWQNIVFPGANRLQWPFLRCFERLITPASIGVTIERRALKRLTTAGRDDLFHPLRSHFLPVRGTSSA